MTESEAPTVPRLPSEFYDVLSSAPMCPSAEPIAHAYMAMRTPPHFWCDSSHAWVPFIRPTD